MAVLLQPFTPAYASVPLASVQLAWCRARTGVQHVTSLWGTPISCQTTQLLSASAVPYSWRHCRGMPCRSFAGCCYSGITHALCPAQAERHHVAAMSGPAPLPDGQAEPRCQVLQRIPSRLASRGVPADRRWEQYPRCSWNRSQAPHQLCALLDCAAI
jgi:hypothetical protein